MQSINLIQGSPTFGLQIGRFSSILVGFMAVFLPSALQELCQTIACYLASRRREESLQQSEHALSCLPLFMLQG